MKHIVFDPAGHLTAIRTYSRHKAIWAYCTQCIGDDRHPYECQSQHCLFFPYRGKFRIESKQSREERRRLEKSTF